MQSPWYLVSKINLDLKIRFFFKLLVAIVFLIIITNRYIDLHEFTKTLIGVQKNVYLLTIFLLITVLLRYLSALQLKLVIGSLSLWSIFKVHLISTFFTFMVPGDLAGGGVTWYFLSNRKGTGFRTAYSIIYIKFINYAAVLPFAVLGVYFEKNLLLYNSNLIIAAVAIPFTVILIFLHSKAALGIGESISDNVFKTINTKKWDFVSGNRKFWEKMRSAQSNGLKTCIPAWILSIIMQMVIVVSVYTVLLCANIHISFLKTIWIMPMLTIVHALPLLFNGTGVREFSLIYMLGHLYGIKPESALLASALILFNAIFFGLIGGLFYLIDSHKIRGQRSDEIENHNAKKVQSTKGLCRVETDSKL